MDAAGTDIREHRDGTTIAIKVYPSSSRRGLGASSAGRIAVYVHSAPEKGKANMEALKVLSDALGVPPSRLELLGARGSRNKTILVHGLSPGETRERLPAMHTELS